MEGRRWENLEMGCLVNIFGKLGIEERILGVPSVCRYWYQASLNPLSWRVLDFRNLNFGPWHAESYHYSITRLMEYAVKRRSCGRVEKLVFPKDATSEDLTFVSNESPSLKVLVLPELFYHEDEESIPGLLNKWKDLEQLIMPNMPYYFLRILEELNQHCKKFVGLATRGWIGNKDALAMVRLLPNIRYLAMSGSTLSKENLIVILKGCRNLEELYLKNCRGFDVDDEILTCASAIKKFHYQGSKQDESDDEDYNYGISMSDVYDGNSDDGYEL